MTTQHNSHLTAPYFPLYRRGALFSSANRGVGVVLRFDPEDQAVLSPALNTAFVFPADTGDGYPSPVTSVGPDLSGFFT